MNRLKKLTWNPNQDLYLSRWGITQKVHIMTDYSLNTSYKEGSTVLNLRVSKISGSPNANIHVSYILN